MLAVAVPVEDLDLEGSVDIAVAQRRHGDLGGWPDGTQGVVDLIALPHHRVLVVLVQSVRVRTNESTIAK